MCGWRQPHGRPPCCIVPRDDPYVSAELAVDMATQLGAETLPFEGCGHWWMFEEPGRAADGLVAFWSGLD